MRGNFVRANQGNDPKTPRIGEAYNRTALHNKINMVVFLRGGDVNRAIIMNGHAPGHAQMDQQHLPIIEIAQNVFRPAGQLIDLAPGHAVDKVFRKRKAQIGAPLHHMVDNMAFHHGNKTTGNGFDLWQFGHRDTHIFQ